MRRRSKNQGFTLIEIIIVIAIIGILAGMVLPKFQSLNQSAKESATKAGLGAVRSTLAIAYAQSATAGATATYPSSLGTADFAGGQLPQNKLNDVSGVTALTTSAAGTATSTDAGFWYVTNTTAGDYGKAGAYSDPDGNTDTSGY